MLEFPSQTRRGFLRGAVGLCGLHAGAVGTTILKGQWQTRVPLRQDVFSIAMGNQIMRAPSETGRPEGSSFLLHNLKALSPPVLRLPGGDGMNSWSWALGRSVESPKAQRMGVNDFAQLARAGHSVPLWGVDAAGAAPSDTQFLARALAGQPAQPQFFELGNELYLPRWSNLVSDADAYIHKAVQHTQVLRKYFPHARCGVPVASYRHLTPTASWGRYVGKTLPVFRWYTPDELDPWILRLARAGDFYDAVVLHLYIVPSELGRNGLAEHTADQVTRWAWVRSDARQIRDLFELVRQVFPNKEIWVTEWAFNTTLYIGKGQAGNKDVRYQAHQTMFAVLYNARFMLNTAYYVPYVPLMTYWTLYGQQTMDLLDKDRTTIQFEMFRLLRWAREGNDGLARCGLSNAPVLHGPVGPQHFNKWESTTPDVFGFYYGGTLRSVAILNVLAQPVSIEFPNVAENGFKDGRALYSKDLLPDWGNPNNPTAGNWHPAYALERIEKKGRIVTVPPNSMSVLHMETAFD